MEFREGNIFLEPNQNDNYISINSEDFFLTALDPRYPFNKGSNSNIFILHDPSGETEDRVIKICKVPYDNRSKRTKKIQRFKREIKAFKIAKKNNLRNVIEFFDAGEVEIDRLIFLYIVMEKAKADLASHLVSKRFSFTNNQKMAFCISVLNGVYQLHNVGIYHRDIKHDNILLVGDEKQEFKVGDLGLVQFQDADYDMDDVNEKIGPYGWLSPEVTNKMLTHKKSIQFTYDCEINQGSDIFQLGKLFWYIFQGNLPLGQITPDDMKFEELQMFEVIFLMLQHQKTRRPVNIEKIESLLEPLKIKYKV